MTYQARTINGPVNVARLENKEMNKVIYLFMDVHNQLNTQSECQDVLSKNIKDFFVDSFKKLDKHKTYDFIVETDRYDSGTLKYSKETMKYLWSIAKLSSQEISFDKKNLIQTSKHFPNVRFHYGDIRYVLLRTDEYHTSYDLEKMLYDYLNYLDGYVHNTYYTGIRFILLDLSMLSDTLKEVLQQRKELFDKSKLKKFEKYNKFYYMYKVYNKYNHSNIKKIMIRLLDEVHENYVLLEKNNVTLRTKIKDTIKEINKYISHKTLTGEFLVDSQYLTELMSNIENMFKKIVESFENNDSTLMDLYFLRRFLDKDYITNGIAYTGEFHSENQMKILVKYFNFKISHIDKIIEPDTPIEKQKTKDELIKILTDNLLRDDPVHKMIVIEPIYQCSDISGFPENFE